MIATMALAGCNKTEERPAQHSTAIPITTAKPTAKEITTYIESIGTLLPSTSVEIRPQVNGILKEVLAAEGMAVTKGTPLFKIDPQLYDIKVQEAKAQHAIDQASLEAVQKKLARYQDLANKDLIAQTEWDDLQAQAAKAKAALDIDTARLTAAQIDLDRCVICSPSDGKLGTISVDPGALLSSGQTTALTTVSKLDPLVAEFTISEKDYAQLKKLPQEIVVEPLCQKGQCSSGKITFIDNKFDTKTGQLLIHASVTNPEHTLRPGQTLRIKIPVSTIDNAILIPYQAVRFNQNGPYAFVVLPDNTAATRQLVIGEEYGDLVHVKEGLASDETIIIDGNMRVTPGAAVEIKS